MFQPATPVREVQQDPLFSAAFETAQVCQTFMDFNAIHLQIVPGTPLEHARQAGKALKRAFRGTSELAQVLGLSGEQRTRFAREYQYPPYVGQIAYHTVLPDICSGFDRNTQHSLESRGLLDYMLKHYPLAGIMSEYIAAQPRNQWYLETLAVAGEVHQLIGNYFEALKDRCKATGEVQRFLDVCCRDLRLLVVETLTLAHTIYLFNRSDVFRAITDRQFAYFHTDEMGLNTSLIHVPIEIAIFGRLTEKGVRRHLRTIDPTASTLFERGGFRRGVRVLTGMDSRAGIAEELGHDDHLYPITLPVSVYDPIELLKFQKDFWVKITTALGSHSGRWQEEKDTLRLGREATIVCRPRPKEVNHHSRGNIRIGARLALRALGEKFEDFSVRIDVEEDESGRTSWTIDFGGFMMRDVIGFLEEQAQQILIGPTYEDLVDSDGNLMDFDQSGDLTASTMLRPGEVVLGNRASLVAAAAAHAGVGMGLRKELPVSHHLREEISHTRFGLSPEKMLIEVREGLLSGL